jgi:hypothetical protein
MSSLYHNLAAVTAAANLIAQLSELNQLRERVRKAELTRRSPQGKRTHIWRLEPGSRLRRRQIDPKIVDLFPRT